MLVCYYLPPNIKITVFTNYCIVSVRNVQLKKKNMKAKCMLMLNVKKKHNMAIKNKIHVQNNKCYPVVIIHNSWTPYTVHYLSTQSFEHSLTRPVWNVQSAFMEHVKSCVRDVWICVDIIMFCIYLIKWNLMCMEKSWLSEYVKGPFSVSGILILCYCIKRKLFQNFH